MDVKRLKLLFFCYILAFFSYQLDAQVNILFQIDMSYQIEQGKFNPDTETVGVAGTFNGWSGSDRFKDDDGDGIYQLTITSFSEGENISYKFRLNNQWDGREEFPGVGNDRVHTVGNEAETLYHWYNNETPPNADIVADFVSNLREFYEQGIITYSDLSAGQVEKWEWTFEGGTPSTSTDKNPIVLYDNPGKYDVQLTITKGDKTSTSIIENYVNVLERNTDNIPWWNETVFYEIFVRSFYDSDGDGLGDFKGMIEKLDYLNDGDPTTTDDLGITGIWLMPIHEAPSYHGYDVTDFKSVKSQYGSMDDFREFLDEAHKRGIKVIIDFVMNHNSSQSEWFKSAAASKDSEFRNFYRWSDNDPGFSGPWGQKVWHQKNGNYYYGLFWDGMPDLNYEEPKVKEAMFDAADFWLEDIGIDGFRLDAVKFIIEEGQRGEDTNGTYLFWNEFNQHYKTTNPEAFTVGEAWTNTETIINYVKNDRIDYCFDFDLAGNILYSANDGQAKNLYEQVQKMYNIYPHLQYGTFLANHDQNRLMNVLNNDESKVKLAAAIYLTLPGIPYLYYGEEIGMVGQKPDEDIRRPMQWNGNKNAGFTTGNPWRAPHGGYPRFNVEREAEDPTSLLNWYKKIIHLRNQNKPLQLGTYEGVPTNQSKVFAFLRSYEGEDILVIHNTGTSVIQNLEIDLSNTSMGSGALNIENLLAEGEMLSVNLNADKKFDGLLIGGRGTKVFKFSRTSTPIQELDNQQNVKVYPNPVESFLAVEVPANTFTKTKYVITDIKGSTIATGTIDLSNEKAIITTQELSNGVYQLTLSDDKFIKNIRFIKGE